MKEKILTSLLLLGLHLGLSPTPSIAQSVVLPAEAKTTKGGWVIIIPKVDGGTPKWRIDPTLQEIDLNALFPGQKAAGKIFTSVVEGKFKVECWNAKGDMASDIAHCWVIVGTPPPPVPPDPGPQPPDPKPPIPPPDPKEKGPFNMAEGLHVLIVYETGAALTKGQFYAIYGKTFRDYIEQKCAKGPDGKTPQRRIYDKDVVLTNESKLWQDAFSRNKELVPRIAVGNGKMWHEGKLPDTEQELMELMKKVGG